MQYNRGVIKGVELSFGHLHCSDSFMPKAFATKPLSMQKNGTGGIAATSLGKIPLPKGWNTDQFESVFGSITGADISAFANLPSGLITVTVILWNGQKPAVAPHFRITPFARAELEVLHGVLGQDGFQMGRGVTLLRALSLPPLL